MAKILILSFCVALAQGFGVTGGGLGGRSRYFVWRPPVVRQPPSCQVDSLTRRFMQDWWIPECDKDDQSLYAATQYAKQYSWCAQNNGKYIDGTLRASDSGAVMDCAMYRVSPPTTTTATVNYTLEPFDFTNENRTDLVHNTDNIVILEGGQQTAPATQATTTTEETTEFIKTEEIPREIPNIQQPANCLFEFLNRKSADNDSWIPSCEGAEKKLFAASQASSTYSWCMHANGEYIQNTLRSINETALDCDKARDNAEDGTEGPTAAVDISTIIPEIQQSSCLMELLHRKMSNDPTWLPQCESGSSVEYFHTQRSIDHSWCVHKNGIYIETSLRKFPEPPADCTQMRGTSALPEVTTHATTLQPATVSTTTSSSSAPTTTINSNIIVQTNHPSVQKQRHWTIPVVRKPPNCFTEYGLRKFRQDWWIPICDDSDRKIFTPQQSSQLFSWCVDSNGTYIEKTLRKKGSDDIDCIKLFTRVSTTAASIQTSTDNSTISTTYPSSAETTTNENESTTANETSKPYIWKPPFIRFPNNCSMEVERRDKHGQRRWIPVCDPYFPEQFAPSQKRASSRWCVETNGEYIVGSVRSKLQPAINCLKIRTFIPTCEYPVHLEVEKSYLESDSLNNLEMGSMVTVTCMTGHHIIGTSTWVCSRSLRWLPITKPGETRNLPVCKPSCGRKQPNSKVWPWVANIENRCTGSVISKRFVITSAACVMDEDEKIIHISNVTLKVNNRLDYNENHMVMPVESIIPHPNYDGGFQFNVAILKLSSDLIFDDTFLPVCIPQSMQELQMAEPFSYGKAIGWGFNWETPSKTVVESVEQILYMDLCFESQNEYEYMDIDDSNVFCAEEMRNSSIGDDGTPFMAIYPLTNEYTLMGVLAGTTDDNTTFSLYSMLNHNILGWIDDIETMYKKMSN